MNGPTKKLLKSLLDGVWHVFDELPKGVGINTVKLCIDQGLVSTKKIDRKQKGDLETYRIAIRINRHGRIALQKNQ